MIVNFVGHSFSLGHVDLTTYFAAIAQQLQCEPATRAYITNLLAKPNEAAQVANCSLTLAWAAARWTSSFAEFQRVGDWVFFARVWAPEQLNAASAAYYDAVARQSYYACYRLLNKQWPLFEELSDRFRELAQRAHESLLVERFSL